ncbi:MAG: hypothetical protein PHQ60_03135 [Sideroxydans sp.]|nr:hypothetical protein [Sideroxydans sp.]
MNLFAGLGLHVFIAVFFAIHAVRNGQPMYWLLILFLFPLMGSAVYFFAIFLPGFRLDHRARRAVSVAAKVLNPQGEMRDAQAAFDDLPTAQNQIRLAEAQFELGLFEAAAKNYEACLKGPFSTSLEIRFGAARAFVECRRFDEALLHLEAIQAIDQAFRREAVSLLLARTYAGTGRATEARSLFESVVERYGSFEARAEYAIWALSVGDTATAARLQAEIDHITKRWSPQAREHNAATMQRLNAALGLAGKRP